MVNEHKAPSLKKLRGEMFSKKSSSKRPPIRLPVKVQPKFWEESDRRIAAVRAIKARYQLLKEDAGGGESYQRDLLIQRAVFLSIILETEEVRAAEGGDFDIGVYTQAANALTGLLKTLGLERHAKNITELREYLEKRKK